MAKHLPIQNSVDQQPQTSAAARQALTRRVLALVGVEKKAAHASHQAAVVTKMENSNAARSDGGKPEAVEVGGDASAVSTSAQLQRRPFADAQPSAWRASVADVSLSAMGGLGGDAAQNRPKLVTALFAVAFASERCGHTVGNSSREQLRPLVNSLVRTPDFFGSFGDAPTQYLDCFCFFHARY